MTDTIDINKGECLHAELAWTNEDGTPIDLTGRTLSIVEAYPAGLTVGTVEITDAATGQTAIRIDAETAALLRSGRTNWIRVGMTLNNGCVNTTNKIWINVE